MRQGTNALVQSLSDSPVEKVEVGVQEICTTFGRGGGLDQICKKNTFSTFFLKIFLYSRTAQLVNASNHF